MSKINWFRVLSALAASIPFVLAAILIAFFVLSGCVRQIR